MDVILIDPPSLDGHINERHLGLTSSPNLGLLYLATYLKLKAEADVNVVDMFACKYDFTDIGWNY